MKKLLKITQILIFSILILLIIVFIWQFFNAYATLLLLPLGFLSMYYLLIHFFVRLMQQKKSKIWLYIGLFFIIVPLIAFSIAYKPILEFSYSILQTFGA